MNIMFGQYLNVDTFLHKLHPLTKLFGLVVFIMVTFLANSFYLYLFQFALLCIILLLTKMPFKILGWSLWNVRYLFLFLFLFNLLFIRAGEPLWYWGVFAVYPQSLLLTINLVLRLLLLTSYAMLFTFTTKPLDLSIALEERFAFLGNNAHILGMILAIALRFIPTLQEEATKIMKAQMARGATFTQGSLFHRAKHLVSLLVPLFIISFGRAETLAVAMELRGYNPNKPRTKFRTLQWALRDTYVMFGICVYGIAVISLKVFA